MIALSESAEAEVAQMASQLQRARYTYHRTGTSPLSDDEYDLLKSKLRAVAPYHLELKAVGAPPDPESPLAKVKHTILMGSVYNSKDHSKQEDYTDGLLRWWHKNDQRTTFGELKGDGLSVRLSYVKGVLKQAATRGDGVEGEDVTHNVRLFKNLPQYLPMPFTGDVRGEAILLKADWLLLGAAGGVTARNTAAGALGRKTGGGDVCSLMHFYAFDLVDPTGKPVDERGNMIRYKSDLYFYLAKLGFESFGMYKLCDSFDQMTSFNAEVGAVRDQLGHDIDGIVWYVDDLSYQYEKGMDSSSCWRSQCAFKFAAFEAETVLTGVTWQVGNAGAHTPVANLAPVQIGGVTVRNASLANPSILAKLGIQINDRVVVSRQGDVIPKVLRRAELQNDDMPRTPIETPSHCLACGGELGSRTNVDGSTGVVLMCLSESCTAKVPGKVARWAKSLKIMGLGDEVISALTEQRTSSPIADFPGDDTSKPGYIGTFSYFRIVENVADLYTLKPDVLAAMMVNGKKFGTKRAKTLLEEIEKTKSLTIEQFIGSLGVGMLGKGRAELIVKAWRAHDWDNGLSADTINNPESWLTTYEPNAYYSLLETYADILGIPKIAAEIQKGLDQSRPVIEALLARGVTVKEPEKPIEVQADSPLVGKSFCFTGVRASEDEMKKMQALGATEKSGVSKGLTFLVTKDVNSTSSKAVKAKEVGATVISYQEFQKMLAL